MNRFFRRFGYAGKGLRTAFSEQFNLKVHTLVAIVVVAAGFHFNLTSDEWLAIIIVIGAVITAELVNTSIEYVVDLVSPAHSPLAGKIKDIAAAAVLIATITACTVGVVVFGKYL